MFVCSLYLKSHSYVLSYDALLRNLSKPLLRHKVEFQDKAYKIITKCWLHSPVDFQHF